MCWQYLGSNAKSAAELNQLAYFVSDPFFAPADTAHFSHEREKKLVEKYLQDHSNLFQADHGWKKLSVNI